MSKLYIPGKGWGGGSGGSGGASSFAELTGQLSNAQIPDAEITAAKLTGVGGGLTVVAETTLAATATDIEITGLDIDADGPYHVQITGVGTNNAAFYAYFNNTTTGHFRHRDTTTGVSDAYLAKGNARAMGHYGLISKIIDGSGNTHFLFNFANASSNGQTDGVTKEFAGDVNLTQLNLTSTTADAWQVGTNVRILKEA